MNNKIRITVAGSYPILVESLALLLSQQEAFHLSGTVTSGQALVQSISADPPHVVLQGLQHQDSNGIVLTLPIRGTFPQMPILFFGDPVPRHLICSLADAGISGYVLSSASLSELLHAIHAVYQGEPYYSPQLYALLLHHAGRMNKKSREKNASLSLLTQKELLILELICKEYTTKEICSTLCLEQSTINTYRQHLLQKTGAKNIAGLVRFALKEGIIAG